LRPLKIVALIYGNPKQPGAKLRIRRKLRICTKAWRKACWVTSLASSDRISYGMPSRRLPSGTFVPVLRRPGVPHPGPGPRADHQSWGLYSGFHSYRPHGAKNVKGWFIILIKPPKAVCFSAVIRQNPGGTSSLSIIAYQRPGLNFSLDRSPNAVWRISLRPVIRGTVSIRRPRPPPRPARQSVGIAAQGDAHRASQIVSQDVTMSWPGRGWR